MTHARSGDSFISARGRATAIVVLVALQLVLMAVSTATRIVYDSSLDAQGADAVARIFDRLNAIDQLLFRATLVVFMTWVYRAIANLPALGSLSARFTPSGAVWSYFIPFVNVVRGHQVMATIWTESQPAAVDDNGLHLRRKATLVHWWWGLYLFNCFLVLPLAVASAFKGIAVHGSSQVQVLAELAWIADAVLFAWMVRAAQKRQEEQWLDLERRRNVPQPTGEALR